MFVFAAIFSIAIGFLSFQADDKSTRAELSLNVQAFDSDNISTSNDKNVSLSGDFDLSSNSNLEYKWNAYGTIDLTDNKRSIIYPKDIYVKKMFFDENPLEFIFGYKVYSKSILEFFHPVNIINAKNFDSNIEDLNSIGELSFEVSKDVTDSIKSSLYFFPSPTNPNLPSEYSRLGYGVLVNDPLYINGAHIDERNTILPSYGLGLDFSFENSELTLQLIDNYDRENGVIGTRHFIYSPILSLNIPTIPMATAHFFKSKKAGLSYQYNFESLILKFEGVRKIYRQGLQVLTVNGVRSPANHSLIAYGLEYNFNFDGLDLLLFSEHTKVLSLDKRDRSERFTFQNDVAIGGRLSLNDLNSKELTSSLLFDLENSREFFYSLSYSQRLFTNFTIESSLRIYDSSSKKEEGLKLIERGDHISLKIARYF